MPAQGSAWFASVMGERGISGCRACAQLWGIGTPCTQSAWGLLILKYEMLSGRPLCCVVGSDGRADLRCK